MSHPKRRHSKTRGRKRRTHQKVGEVNLSGCSNCGENILPHRICPHCGYYKGRPVIVQKVKEKKDREAA